MQINRLNEWIKVEVQKKSPTLSKIIAQTIDDNPEKSNWQKTTDLKAAANMLVFLQGNHIENSPQLQDKVAEIKNQNDTICSQIQANERRMKELDEHIKQSENYFMYRNIHDKNKHLEGWVRDDY